MSSLHESIYYNISSVNEAICCGRQISFLYYNYDEKKRKVYHNDRKSPCALVWKDENYYEVGYYEQYRDYVYFHADKMMRVEILEQAVHNPMFDVNGHCRRLFGMFGEKSEQVRLWFDNSLAAVAVNRFGLNTVFYNKGDSFELEVELDVSPAFFGLLFQFGSMAEIVSPQWVRENFKRYALDTLKQDRKNNNNGNFHIIYIFMPHNHNKNHYFFHKIIKIRAIAQLF